ncbi:MAG: hypothetical protein M3167_06155 [Acidobacteriota bacterium]|nr:hypothetical protein [Acidobacteriota bacterium]MDQ6892247.1 hypothetical protein [Acidobacteriota bacterium]
MSKFTPAELARIREIAETALFEAADVWLREKEAAAAAAGVDDCLLRMPLPQERDLVYAVRALRAVKAEGE